MRTNYKICKALILLYETTLIFSKNDQFTTPIGGKNKKKYSYRESIDKESIDKKSSSKNKLYSNSKIKKTPSNSPENSGRYDYFNGHNYTKDSYNSSSMEKQRKLIDIISSTKEKEKNLNYIPISDEENTNSNNTNIMKNLFSVFTKESIKQRYNEIDKNTETNDNTEKTDADKQDNSKKTILYINHGGSTDKTNCCLCCR